jgi:hypothetical protein
VTSEREDPMKGSNRFSPGSPARAKGSGEPKHALCEPWLAWSMGWNRRPPQRLNVRLHRALDLLAEVVETEFPFVGSRRFEETKKWRSSLQSALRIANLVV